MLPSNVVGLPPLGYFDMLSLQKMSSVIITDSGGLQEAFFHATPCITIRPETEWVETLDAGWNKLVWGDINQLMNEVQDSMANRPSDTPKLFGSGDAAQKIAKIIKNSGYI